MSPRSAGLLLLVAALLGAFVYLYEIRGEEGRVEAAAREKRLFPGLEAEAIRWIELQGEDGRRLRAERRVGGWRLTAPLDFPGDAFALDGMATALAQLESEAAYPEPQPGEVYGLGEEAAEIRFGAGEAEHALRTGDATPLGGNSYVRVAGSETVHAVPSYRVNALHKALADLREKKVLDFDRAAVRALVLRWPGRRVALRRSEGGWQMEAPLEGPADGEAVDNLLSGLSFLRARGFEDEPPPDAQAGLDPPAFAVELELEAAKGESEPRRLSFALGAELVDGDLLARGAEVSLYRIAPERLEDFPRELVAYRDRRLAEFSPPDVRRLEIAFAEGVTVVAAREDAGWQAEPEPLDPAKLSRMVDVLSRLSARDILAESVGADELRALGLEPAAVRFSVYGEDADSPLARVRLGAARGDAGAPAQRDDAPQVFELDPALAEQLPLSLAALREHFLRAEEEPSAASPDEPSGAPAAP